jgi:hypothetical protein
LTKVLHWMRVMEGDGSDGSESAAPMAVCRPVGLASDFDPSAGVPGDYAALAAAASLGTPGVLHPSLLDSLLHEAAASQQSCLHLAATSGDLSPWGDPKAAQHLAQLRHALALHAAGAVAHEPPPLPLAALRGHGPHPVGGAL